MVANWCRPVVAMLSAKAVEQALGLGELGPGSQVGHSDIEAEVVPDPALVVGFAHGALVTAMRLCTSVPSRTPEVP